jgi:hypothetical protein
VVAPSARGYFASIINAAARDSYGLKAPNEKGIARKSPKYNEASSFTEASYTKDPTDDRVSPRPPMPVRTNKMLVVELRREFEPLMASRAARCATIDERRYLSKIADSFVEARRHEIPSRAL